MTRAEELASNPKNIVLRICLLEEQPSGWQIQGVPVTDRGEIERARSNRKCIFFEIGARRFLHPLVNFFGFRLLRLYRNGRDVARESHIFCDTDGPGTLNVDAEACELTWFARGS